MNNKKIANLLLATVFIFIALFIAVKITFKNVADQPLISGIGETYKETASEEERDNLFEWIGFKIPENATNISYVDDGGIDTYVFLKFEIGKSQLENFIIENTLELKQSFIPAEEFFNREPSEVNKQFTWWDINNETIGASYKSLKSKLINNYVFIVESEKNYSVFIEAWDL